MPGVTVDGNDFSAVAEAVHNAIARARAGDGPSLVENLTYRWRGHSKSDRNRYRTKEEIEDWMKRDPIARFQAELIAHGLPPDTPALLAHGVTTPDQVLERFTITTLARHLEGAATTTPALIFYGPLAP